jgi:hypothetical protein
MTARRRTATELSVRALSPQTGKKVRGPSFPQAGAVSFSGTALVGTLVAARSIATDTADEGGPATGVCSDRSAALIPYGAV